MGLRRRTGPLTLNGSIPAVSARLISVKLEERRLLLGLRQSEHEIGSSRRSSRNESPMPKNELFQNCQVSVMQR